MADPGKKGAELMQQAKKKATSTGGLVGSLFGGGSSKLEDAAELYARAANSFKMAKMWNEAGEAFREASAVHAKLQSRHDSATSLVDAANCFRKSAPQEAVTCLERAIEIYCDMGRFSIAAKHHNTIAEICETELNDTERAIQHYEKAADFFKGEEATSSANKCMLKVAQYAAQLEHFDKAINIYEAIAATSMDSTLLKYSVKEYYFKAALCHLCVDLLNAQHAIAKYEEAFPSFADSRECKLLKALIGHLEESAVDGFTEEVTKYDQISRLDPWTTSMLLRVKKQIAGEPELC